MRRLLTFTIHYLLFTIAIQAAPIDRHALVTRHNVTLNTADTLNALSVGNGKFAATVDITGMQSFAAHYAEAGLPLATQSEWGWHSFPNTEGYTLADTYQDFDTYGRPVPYPFRQHTPAGQFLRGNPHRISLGQFSLEISLANGETATLADFTDVSQTLDLWTGEITSHFSIEDTPVTVTTLCHPKRDLLAFRIESPLLEQSRIQFQLAFPYGTAAWGIDPSDWSSPEKHTTTGEAQPFRHTFTHTLDDTRYYATLLSDSILTARIAGPHTTTFLPEPSATTSFVLDYSESAPSESLPTFDQTRQANATSWQNFWTTGGAIDLSGSTDPRAHELERRIVLSQYLTAIQCRGQLPPQETGLTFNSWYGKPHLEMHWWHAVHFALWNHIETVEAVLPWYKKILPKAREIAATQGYDGARWPKNVDADGKQVPSAIAPLLIWQQPHPIYLAELVYRQKPTRQTLDAYSDLVFQTAAFMASYPVLQDGSYQLGPPLIPAQESYDPTITKNPPFELAYWRWALETAQVWRNRLDLPPETHWQTIIENLAPYPLYDDLYATAQDIWNGRDHPSVLAAYGMINGRDIDPDRMRRTLRHVLDTYDWQHTWGWDYPMIAMTAARLGDPDTTIDALLLDVPKNTYLKNGHNYQEPGNLRIYLPGNGGLLAAVAMMAAGWTDAPITHAPGFPQNNTWKIQHENLHPLP